tara:strand:+ start:164 stop:637 length:474 start_codon:yes stop_codon:yes gene_type:complete
MSSGFSKNFQQFVGQVVQKLGAVGKPGNLSTRVNKSALSPNVIKPGDVLFFNYRSDKFGTGNHLVLVVGSKRGPYGVFQHKGKRYLSAVKLNNIWSYTATIIIKVFRERSVKYTSTKESATRIQKGFMSLVGRKNYRTYIMNNINNQFEVSDKEEKV